MTVGISEFLMILAFALSIAAFINALMNRRSNRARYGSKPRLVRK